MTFVVIAISCLSFCLTCMPCECVCVSECLVVHTQKALLLLCCRHNSCGIDFSFSHFLCLMFNTKETVAAFWMFSSCEFISWVNKYTCFMRLFKSLIPKFFFFFFISEKEKNENCYRRRATWKNSDRYFGRVVLQVRENARCSFLRQEAFRMDVYTSCFPHPPGDFFCPQGWLSSAVLGIKLDSGFWTRLVCLPL